MAFGALGFLAAVVIALLAAVTHLTPTTVFDPVLLKQIANNAIQAHGGNATLVVEAVMADLRSKYPKHIMDGNEWMFNNAGGAMGSMIVLHASFSE